MKFVVAADGSEESERALLHAIDLATATDGALTVVYAADPEIQTEGSSGPFKGLGDAEGRLLTEPIEDAEERGQRILDNAAEIAGEEGIEVETELLYGDPVEALADYLESESADGLILGHRGLSPRLEEQMGSVAKAMLERSPVPVTVVN